MKNVGTRVKRTSRESDIYNPLAYGNPSFFPSFLFKHSEEQVIRIYYHFKRKRYVGITSKNDKIHRGGGGESLRS